MKYEDIPQVKQNKNYNVPKDFFEKNFSEFEKNYKGYYMNNTMRIDCEAYRAFEIMYMNNNLKLKEKKIEAMSEKIQQSRSEKRTSEKENQRT